MNKGLRIAAIVISLCLLAYSLVISIIEPLVIGPSWFNHIDLMFFALIVAFSFLLSLNKAYSFVIFILSIAFTCKGLMTVIFYHTYIIYEIISLVLYVALLSISIVLFVKAKPFKEDADKKVASKNRNSFDRFEEIKKLKELLDCGALTQEEFDVEKKKAIENR